MEDDHYNEWISPLFQEKEKVVYLNPGDAAKQHFAMSWF